MARANKRPRTQSRHSQSSEYFDACSDSEDEKVNKPLTNTLHLHTITVASPMDAPQTSITTVPVPVSPKKKVIPSTHFLQTESPSPHFDAGAPEDQPAPFNFIDIDAWDEESELKETQRIRTASDNPLGQWLVNDRDTFLGELLRHDSYGLYDNTTCGICGQRQYEYRCTDCFGGQRLCLGCMQTSHVTLPLHRIERWTGKYFERTKLKNLGVRMQLNHPPFEKCFNPKPAYNDDFVIVDSFGVHNVGLDFCECECAPSHSIQLLRARLYPATGTYPNTAATFRVLQQFHLLSFESKCSGYEFFNCISRLTNNVGSPPRSRYDEFMRMVRQWRHLKMLKRTGRGHNPRGIGATRPGQCALLCPACPQPGINLPLNWENAPQDKMWLYALFVAVDANFKLQRKRVSSDERDPGLGNGWAFFVDETSYKEYLTQNWDHKQDRSTCMSHDAVNKPDREARGLAASGAGTIDCARHDLKRPNGVGDLQLGERYINMDYLFFSSLQHSNVRQIVVSYDIACQWYKKIFTRMTNIPRPMQLRSVQHITFLVPKFHLPAHIEDCNLQFSFNLTKGVGRTDGEAPERGWAHINPVAQSTKEMGPGSRRDTLDDHFNDWNWKKIVTFGERILSKIQEAVPARAEHYQILKDFERPIPREVIDEWTRAVEKWEIDCSQPNPLRPKIKTMSERAARLQLAAEAAEEGIKESSYHDHDLHPSVMIANGLQLEDEQRRLAADIEGLGEHPTTKQLTEILKRSNLLRRKIATWTEEQVLHMPQVAPERMRYAHKASPDGTMSTKVTHIPLFLPSTLPKNVKIDKNLQAFEWKLREGQAYDALEELRHVLRLRTHLYKHKVSQSAGVKANTRSNVAIKSATARIQRCVGKYRAARTALLNLAPRIELNQPMWEYAIRELADDDVRGLSDALYGDSEGRRKPSWIWMTYGNVPENDDNPAFNEALRIEWCRARARAMRWDEEVELLQEEMRWILAFLDWEVAWWERQGDMSLSPDAVTMKGMVAYAHRQASSRQMLRDRFAMLWRDIPAFLQLWDGAIPL